MFPVILFMFYLILPPSATQMCALWLSQPATAQDLAAACPADIKLENYQVNFRNIWDNKIYCTANATAIYNPAAACNLTPSLDNFRMEIFAPPGPERVVCSLTSYNATPSRAEIASACSFDALTAYDSGAAQLRNMGAAPTPTRAELPQVDLPTGAGLYAQASSTAELTTNLPLSWLAGRMIWYGQVQAECPGGTSGLDQSMAANACGQAAASANVRDWQNQFDQDIYAAALAEGVPARLLKSILIQESQLWPLWHERPAGETGMAQITLAGADQYLRWYDRSYPGADGLAQQQLQQQFLTSLECHQCTLAQAIEHERANIVIYARILRAYRYSATDWRGAVELWNGEAYANQVESSFSQ